MRLWKWTLGITLVNAALVPAAFADGLRQPASPVAFEYEYYQPKPAEAVASPSDKPAPMAPAPMAPAPMGMAPAAAETAPAAAPAGGDCGCHAAPASDCGCGCDSGCGCHSGCDLFCKLDCPEACPQWKAFDDCCFLKEHGMTLEGYWDIGGTGNNWNPGDHWNGPVGTNDRNEVQVNQGYIALEKATKAGDCCWDLGGRIDMLWGTDARWYESRGLEQSAGVEKWTPNQRFYHTALVQAYAEVAYSDWKTKFGKWNTPIGYEVIDSRGNFFYSHSYAFLYAGPFTNTGLLATRTVDDYLNYSLGFTTGWDNVFDNNNKVDFIGSISLTSCDKNTNLVFSIISGDERNQFNNETNRTMYDITLTRKLNERLTWVFEHDLGVQANGANNGTKSATWYGIDNYLTYQLNCNWWLGGRFEWFRDNDGTRVAAIGDSLTTAPGGGSNLASAGGFNGNFFEYTVGLNYKPLTDTNLVVRPEVRYDRFDGAANPFNGGTKKDQVLFAVDAIIKY